MRLAFCNATRRWGGVKTWSVEFAGSLAALGHEVTVYGRDPAFIERARAAGLKARLVSFGCDFNPVSTAWFYRHFKRTGVDAVLVNVGKDLRTAGAAARLLGLPLVQRIGLPRDIRDCAWARLSHYMLRPHYLCPCRYIRDGMLEALPFVHRGDTTVIHSAKTPLPACPVRVSGPLRIVSTSQVNANKGHLELAHTLARLRREGHAFFWEIAGEGACLEELRGLCEGLGLKDAVSFHGFTQNVTALIASCDIFVLSSYTEGLPNTLLEAMAAGLVPVARSVGGVEECWPKALPFAPVPFEGWEKGANWSAKNGAPDRQLPLYAPLKRVLTAGEEDILHWKQQTLDHMRSNFSLASQAKKLEEFFLDLIRRRK